MKNNIYSSNREEILKRIKELAESYTPEWKFDTENPDAGSVIGMIFAEQVRENLEKLNLVMENYHREFVNLFGISLKPADPALGAAVLHLEEGAFHGIPLLKGTPLLGEDETGEEIVFETLHDLFAGNVKLTDIIFSSPKRDKKIPFRGSFLKMDFGREKTVPFFGEGEELKGEIPFFSDVGKSMGNQALMISHSHLFEIQEEEFSLRFFGNRDSSYLAKLFGDKSRFRFFYVKDSRVVPFKLVYSKEDTVVLVPFSHEKVQNILLIMESYLREDIRIYDIELTAEDPVMEPDFVWDGTRELPLGEFHPFGEELAPYREVYIGQQSLMDYSGGKMWMEFDLSFEEFAGRKPQMPPDLRLIKRLPRQKSAPAEYDCYMDEVSLEYFNGKGFRKLHCDREVEKIFSREDCSGRYCIYFDMPGDWESIPAGGYEQRCIRFQGVRADNCYLPNVKYHYPVIKNLRFGILYREENLRPERVIRFRGISTEDITENIRNKKEVLVFSGREELPDRMYLGFSGKFQGGPVGLYFQVEEKQYGEDASLSWFYSCKKGFKPLTVTDHTKNLHKSGVLLFMPPKDMAVQEIEGSKRYWIGVEDTNGFYSRKQVSPPMVKDIFVNAVEIKNIETLEEQDYFLEVPRPGMKFPLYTDNILYARVWVNEKGELSEEEMKNLLKECPQNVRAEYNFLGEIEEFYVLWQETDGFLFTQNSRCYRIDRGTNEIIFGDGVDVWIPKNRESAAFKVQVTRCSGEKGNISSHTSLRFRGNMGRVEHIETPGKVTGGWGIEQPGDALKRGGHVLSGRKRLVSALDYEREAKLFSHSIDKVSCVAGQKNGRIKIVLLMKDYKKGSQGFYAVKHELKQHFLTCCELAWGEEEIEIAEPVFVKISVKLWVSAEDMTESIEIRKKWPKEIDEYLEPVAKGEHRGWDIGKLPSAGQLRMRLNSMDCGRLSNFSMWASYQEDGLFYETDLEQMECKPDMVCLSGEHEVFVTV